VVARSRAEPAIKDSSPDEGDAMSPPWRPTGPAVTNPRIRA
jgi:hypothetical protein